MKKRLTFLIISVMIVALLYGCGGSAGTDSNTPAEGAPENSETAETQAASEKEETEAPPAETAPEETGEISETPSGFKCIGKTEYYADGSISCKEVYDQDGYLILFARSRNEGDPLYIQIFDKETDADGKWTGYTIYLVPEVSELDPENLDVYRTEENVNCLEQCTYNESGLVVERVDTSGNLVGKFTYNDQYQKVQDQHYSQGECIMQVDRSFDEHGILSQEIESFPGSESKYVTDYTPIGVVPFQTGLSRSDDEDWALTTDLDYDENGILLGGIRHEPAGFGSMDMNSPAEDKELSFELDEYGNLIHCEMKSDNGETYTIDWDILPVYE